MKQKLLITIITLCATIGLSAQHATIAIFSLNDFHGGFVKDTSKDIPGVAAIWQTLDSLRAIYPHNITVSAGDNFGGSYFYKATKEKPLPVFFNKIGIDLSAVGNHEFDDGVEKLAKKWADIRPAGWDITYVCANVTDSLGQIPLYMQPTAIREIPISPKKSVKAGFLGLLTSSTPAQVSKSRIKGLQFSGDYKSAIEKYKHQISNADIRLTLMHVGTTMRNGKPAWNDPDEANLLSINDPFFHGMLTGHSHEPVVGRINNTQYPAVQGKWHGEYISIIKCRIDTNTMKVVSAEPELVHVNPNITLDSEKQALANYIDSLLRTTTIGGEPLEEKIAYSREQLIHDRSDKYKQTRMGELVCESYAEAARKAGSYPDEQVIIGMSHFGSIRGGFNKGIVRVLDVGEALPFANSIKVFELSGKQIKKLVDFGLHNEKYGWLQTGWLEIETNAHRHVRRLNYISPKGKRIKIKNRKKYLVAVDSYQAEGGDGYGPFYFIPQCEIKLKGLPNTMEAFTKYLKEIKTF